MSERAGDAATAAIRVLRGHPTDEELAALVTVLIGRAAAVADDAVAPSLWRDHTALLRAPLLAGRGAWRASALPS